MGLIDKGVFGVSDMMVYANTWGGFNGEERSTMSYLELFRGLAFGIGTRAWKDS
jgi:hypothetical protein